jgi:hypothetical protein
MPTAAGVVRDDAGVADVLVEVFAVPDDFQSRLPVADRAQLATLDVQRLGSGVTDERGAFRIDYDASKAPPNLWLIASRPNDPDPAAIAYQDRVVRHRAAPFEQFVVAIASRESPTALARAAPATRDVEDVDRVIRASRTQLRGLATAVQSVQREERARRDEIRSRFRADVGRDLARSLSSVVRKPDGTAADPNFVEPGMPVRAHAERRITDALERRFQRKAQSPLLLKGRLALTGEQLKKLLVGRTVDPETQTVTVTEQDVATALGQPVADDARPASIARREVMQEYCRPKSRGERCLAGEDVDADEDAADGAATHGGHGAHPDGGADDTGEERDGSATRSGRSTPPPSPTPPTVADLKSRLPGYLADILDERTPLDTGIAGVKGPGTQLTADEVAAKSTFPSLQLPPGPADVPAYYEFHNLQIAFEPVWTEAFDASLLQQAEAAYERFVELGGDPAALGGVRFWPQFTSILGQLLSPLFNPIPEHVVAHIDVTTEEWNALPADYQSRLDLLAANIRTLKERIQVDTVGSHKFLDGLDGGDQQAFESVVKYVETRSGAYLDEAHRIIRYARAELERRTSGQSPVPDVALLNQLKARATSQYPARYFAANRKEHSVNFGLLVTYRQCWTPVCYQVGELIKSIPLAPREVRRYAKKTVIREKRARKEVETHLTSQKNETQTTSRAESEIVQKAMQKTNFSTTASGTFQIGVADANASSTLSSDTQGDSAETKKSFHEAVARAAREYRNELKIEVETEVSSETDTQESGEISNPNDELTVTYLFYELQRRYRVNERLHRLRSVVLVAQEMPAPAEIDEDWLIANRWILNRVLLDDGFRAPLTYVAEQMAAEEFALKELKRALLQQRTLVEELKGEVLESRRLTESRYAALQVSMERTARAAQRSSSSGGLLGFAKNLTALPVVEGFADRFLGTAGEAPEAARIREAATRDAYEREVERLRDFEERLLQANNSLATASNEYADRLAQHLGNVVRVTELRTHVKDNVLHYMQAIWLHEPPDQRWMRLKDVPVPDLRVAHREFRLSVTPVAGALGQAAHQRRQVHAFDARCGTMPPGRALPTVPLVEVADIDTLLGFKANYMIFGLKSSNAITSFMMEPYLDRAAEGFGITDPDDAGNMTLEEFSDYVCCLKKHLTGDQFLRLKDTLEAQLKTLLESPLRDDEEIVVPLDALYIEALPGARPILENFKLLHRQLDAADAQEKLRLHKLEKLRYAQRLLDDELGDPEVQGQYVFQGFAPGAVVPPAPPGGGGGP